MDFIIDWISKQRDKLTKNAVKWILTVSISSALMFWFRFKLNPRIQKVGLMDIVGNTPLIYLPRLSKACGAEIYCKAEFLNPFGSSKDRAIKKIVTSQPQDTFSGIVEASSGSTAISLIHFSHILGKKASIYLPNDLSQDKYFLLQILKAKLIKVPPVSIVDPNHFFNLALSKSSSQGVLFTNQFQNLLNYEVHYQTTGPEIYAQTNKLVDTFICGSGTGGTLAGVSQFLKEKNSKIRVVLADIQGSGLFNKVKYNTLFAHQQREGTRLKNPFDTVLEGIGLNRVTKNFKKALIDDAIFVSDLQALHMCHYLIQNEGLFAGGSTAVNLVAAVKYARQNPHQNIVTVMHDSGARYLKKIYDEEYLHKKGIEFIRKDDYTWDDLSFVL